MTNQDGKKLIFGLTKTEVAYLAVGFMGEGILLYRGLLGAAAVGAGDKVESGV